MAARSRLPLIAALALGGGGGYYLYNAGGNPKVAEKQLEHDAARLSTKVRDELPGRGKEVKTEAKVLGEQAGAKLDETLSSAKTKSAEYEAKAKAYAADTEKSLEKYRKEASKDLNAAVDKFDKTVEEKVSTAKTGISSWFGGK